MYGHTLSFDKLKEKLVCGPILASNDPTLPCEIHTDTSLVEVAHVLIQRDNENKPHVIWYGSRECRAIVDALQKLREYTYGQQINLRSSLAR